MNDELRELIASDVGDELHECPLCLSYIYDDGTCDCTDESIAEYVNWVDTQRKERGL